METQVFLLKRLLYFLTVFFLIASSPELMALQSLPDSASNIWYYQETFSDKLLKNNQIIDKNGKVIWRINTVQEQKNAITNTGALELGNARYMQRAVLAEEIWGEKQNYAMEFNINLQKIGDEGYSGRPIAAIIPRAKDKEFTAYYAVTYFMENTIANQFKFKWAIINTAAPTKMKPLVEGYYLLKEDVDYTARLVIQNTREGNVNIRFYIDGPINPVKEYKPLLEYTDSSGYKIPSGATGPALGMVGYSDAGWGVSPVVRYDNIRLFEIHPFGKYEEELRKNARANPQDIESINMYGEIKYLINKGIMEEYSDHTFRPHESISVAQFLKALITLKGEKYPAGISYWNEYYVRKGVQLGIVKVNEFPDNNKPVTRFDAALLIARFYGNPTGDKKYLSLIRDWATISKKYLNAVLYAYYEGYLRLDDNFEFTGDQLVTRADASAIILRMLDAGCRKVNYDLELPGILSTGAVFQGNKKISIWGRGVSGETITVRFKNQVKTAVVKNGHWYLELDPVPYGGPYTLKVNSTKKRISLYNVKVGEVFIVAGQSNAEMFLADCFGAKETRKKFFNSFKLRFYTGEKITAVRPNFTSNGSWNRADGWVLDSAPAIGIFFVEKLLELNKELAHVTIGIIRMSYGGTTIEAFMPNAITAEQKYVQKDNEPIMSGFWNGFMEPIAPFAVRGVIYYQGENSTHLGYRYEPLLRDYLRGLRTEFHDLHLPVVLVQLAGYGYNDYKSDRDAWPLIREVQLKVANTTNNTGLVTAVDLADPNPNEIHSREKKKLGERLAYLTMNLIYGKQCEKRSAELKFYKLQGNKVIVGFDYDYGMIYLKDNIENSFQILDRQGRWQKANAVVHNENNTVAIWNDEIAEPLGVRYAWVNYPNVCLYNNVDYPVMPFRAFIGNRITGKDMLKIPNHMLKSYDAIVNTTRDNQFRLINVIVSDTVAHEYPISGQSAGDTIEKFSRLTNLKAQEGTTETVIKISRHGLSVGDWIRNDTRGWEARRVIRVIDEDTIMVNLITGQSAGDDIGRFHFVGKAVAE
jgi:sialate O-acetylesterase